MEAAYSASGQFMQFAKVTMRPILEPEFPKLAELMRKAGKWYVTESLLTALYRSYEAKAIMGAFTQSGSLIGAITVFSQTMGPEVISLVVHTEEKPDVDVIYTLLNKALKSPAARAIIAYSIPSLEKMYLTKGFMTSGLSRLCVDIDLHSVPFFPNKTPSTLHSLRDISPDGLANIALYDGKLQSRNRQKFLTFWIQALLGNGGFGFEAISHSGRTTGFIMCVPEGFWISCFYAETMLIALELLRKVVQTIKSTHPAIRALRMTFPNWNTEGVKTLLGTASLPHSDPMLFSHVMCTDLQSCMGLPWHKIYSVTNEISELF